MFATDVRDFAQISRAAAVSSPGWPSGIGTVRTCGNRAAASARRRLRRCAWTARGTSTGGYRSGRRGPSAAESIGKRGLEVFGPTPSTRASHSTASASYQERPDYD